MVMIFIAALLSVIIIIVWRISMDVSTLLASLNTLSADVDTLLAQSTAPDLQPVADAISAIDAKVKAKITTPST